MASAAVPASTEWKAHWTIVLAAAIGFSLHSIGTYSSGLFMEPLGKEFGWSRAQISAGLSIAAMSAIPLSPIVGAMIDRWGSRRLAISGIILTALSFVGFSTVNGTVAHWLALWTFYSLVTLGVKATVWTAAISGIFSTARGMAIAVTMSGTAIAQILVPPITHWLIENFGWRQAYIYLGVGWAMPALILAIFFLFDARDLKRLDREKLPNPGIAEGLSIAEALRSRALWRIGISAFITMLLGIAALVHQVPILTGAGVSRQNAAWLASMSGVAGIAGKLITGWLMDRMHAVRIGGITLAIAAVAFALLLEPFRSAPTIVLAMIIIGYSGGAKLQIAAYLASRYGGLRNFGKIFGTLNGLFAAGAGLGPVMAGHIFDTYGSYTPFLILGIPGSLLCGFLIFGLGPYPDHKAPEPAPAA